MQGHKRFGIARGVLGGIMGNCNRGYLAVGLPDGGPCAACDTDLLAINDGGVIWQDSVAEIIGKDRG